MLRNSSIESVFSCIYYVIKPIEMTALKTMKTPWLMHRAMNAADQEVKHFFARPGPINVPEFKNDSEILDHGLCPSAANFSKP